MSRYCLDTSAYSHFKHGDRQVVDLIDAADWIGMPSIVLGELWVGFLAGAHLARSEVELQEFVAHPVVEQLPVDHDVARLYGEIIVALKEAGTPLPTNDIWIAATAVRSGAAVLTYDTHFDAIKRVGSVILEASH